MYQTLSTGQYAAIRNITAAAVRMAIKRGHRLPGIIKREKIGRDHILHFDKKKLEKDLAV